MSGADPRAVEIALRWRGEMLRLALSLGDVRGLPAELAESVDGLRNAHAVLNNAIGTAAERSDAFAQMAVLEYRLAVSVLTMITAHAGAELKAAQERGEVARRGEQDRVRDNVPSGNIIPATLPEIGLTRKQAAIIPFPGARDPGG